MRRGLIHWDPAELPLATLESRTSRLRAEMARQQFDAIILYTNFIRCAAVSWLTGFSPYWADGILVVPALGELLFATTLSKRMGMWIQTVMPNASVVTSPNPGQFAGKRLAEAGARRVAILELDNLPGGLYAELAAALPNSVLADGSAIFGTARMPVDEIERALLQHADQIAETALLQIERDLPMSAGAASGAVEKSARMAGAEEVYVAVAPISTAGNLS